MEQGSFETNSSLLDELTAVQIAGEPETPTHLPFKILCLIGIILSVLCFIIQGLIFFFIRISRKTDEKILAQITFTRILVTLCEYYLIFVQGKTALLIVFGVYFVSDFAIICLMLAFTKHIYDKTVIVFSARKFNLIYVSIIIWTISFILGFTLIYILKYHTNYFELYGKVIFASVKLIISTLNLIVYFKIFYVAYYRVKENDIDIMNAAKTACVAFLLIATTCLQTLITDFILFSSNVLEVVVNTFVMINSYHAVFITIIFIIILKSKMTASMVNNVSVRLSDIESK